MTERFLRIHAFLCVYNNSKSKGRTAMKRILFTGGGSAGHVVPNIALMEELLRRGDVDLCYMGGDGIEKKLVAPLRIPYYTLRPPKFIRGGGFYAFKENIKIPFRLKKAVEEAKKGLFDCKPDLVFSKGGFVALPVVMAAKKMGIPCYAHESDLSVGLANKLSAKKCEAVFTSFPETAIKIKNGVYSGAPIRRSVFTGNRDVIRKKYGVIGDQKVLLVFGGGSGSEAINSAIRKHLKTLTEKYVIFHLCGRNNRVESTMKGYIQEEFALDMGGLYAMSDALLCRAGAGSVFEAMSLKKPTLFVPLSKASRGDQKQKAEHFHRKGLCRVLPEEYLERLPQAIDKLFEDDDLKERLRTAVFKDGRKFITQQLTDALQK